MLILLLYVLTIFSFNLIKKFYDDNFKGTYLFQFWSLIISLILWYYYPEEIALFKTDGLYNYKNILLILLAVIPTAIIVNINKPKVGKRVEGESTKLLNTLLDGAMMEFPQRLVVQNLFIILGVKGIIYGDLNLAILLTAIIWVQFIIIQELINNRSISLEILREITASFWFSIWVGILYSLSGNIVVVMLSHSLQRLVSYLIRKRLIE